MIAVVVYAVVAALVFPREVRRRYVAVRSSHPHTHPRDVRYDLTHAAAGGAWRACLWGPRVTVWAGHRAVVWVTVSIVGRRRIARDLRTARIERYEAELVENEALLVTVRDLQRRVTATDERLSRMLSA